MIRRSSAFGLALAVVAVLGLARPAAAGDPVPFMGTLAGNETNTPLDPPFVKVYLHAEGRADPAGSVRAGRFGHREHHHADRGGALRLHRGQRRHADRQLHRASRGLGGSRRRPHRGNRDH